MGKLLNFNSLHDVQLPVRLGFNFCYANENDPCLHSFTPASEGPNERAKLNGNGDKADCERVIAEGAEGAE